MPGPDHDPDRCDYEGGRNTQCPNRWTHEATKTEHGRVHRIRVCGHHLTVHDTKPPHRSHFRRIRH